MENMKHRLSYAIFSAERPIRLMSRNPMPVQAKYPGTSPANVVDCSSYMQIFMAPSQVYKESLIQRCASPILQNKREKEQLTRQYGGERSVAPAAPDHVVSCVGWRENSPPL